MPAIDDQVFVLRFWLEPGAEGMSAPHHWRARVFYVNDGKQFHTPGIEHAFELIRSLVRARYGNDDGQRAGYATDGEGRTNEQI